MDLVLSIVVLAALALLAGAFFIWRRTGPTRQMWLMLLLAAIMIANVLVWTVPDGSAFAPIEQSGAGQPGAGQAGE